MLSGFVGLGAVVETAYLPALRNRFNSSLPCPGFDVQPNRQPDDVTRCSSLAALLSHPLDTLFITTASLNHLEVLELALASSVPRIVVEKPVVATLSQIATLKTLLSTPDAASRVLALDHWMTRTDIVRLGLIERLADVVKIEGFLQEPSGFNDAGEPVALNFATGEPDTRTLRHPDGVILDIGTHVLAMIRETVHALGGSSDMDLQVMQAKDRLGKTISKGDVTTAEGEAHLQGLVGGVPVDIWLKKYAGPSGGQKGLRITLRDGRIVSHDRRGPEDVLESVQGDSVQQWRIPGTLYERCLAEQILGEQSLFTRCPQEVPRTTRRRLEEVELLLSLQQRLRGPH
ncbi:oxidoreductase [Enterobacter sp.]|uniref:oxidoreductase n=1 Tax=Enterobacter sp. TaxID=42895 RepID=UPI003A8F27E2